MIGETSSVTSLETERGPRVGFAVDAAFVVAVLLAAISIGGLLSPALYVRETSSWSLQAIAQDWFDLVIAVPLLLATALWARAGSRRGLLVLAGVLLFAVYTLIIYAFAVHLNAFFLIYCTALGVAVFALISVAQILSRSVPTRTSPQRVTGAYLIGIGVAFGALWLGQLVPAAITGQVPTELAETGLPTNPIHVIDLSFILPLHVIVGVMLLRRRPVGLVLAPVLLGFGAVMSASIGFLVLFASGALPLVIAMAAISAVAIGLLVRLLRATGG